MELAEKLIIAREKRGLNMYKAAKGIGVGWTVLATLEGSNPKRESGGSNVKLRTATAVIEFYFPDITLADFGIDENLVVGRVGADGKVKVPKQ